jgi:hypothetical protein
MCHAKQQSDRRPEWADAIDESAHTKAYWMISNALEQRSHVPQNGNGKQASWRVTAGESTLVA